MRDLARLGDQIICRIALRGHHHHRIIARGACICHNARHIHNAVSVGNRAAAEFLYDQCHQYPSFPRGSPFAPFSLFPSVLQYEFSVFRVIFAGAALGAAHARTFTMPQPALRPRYLP